MPKIGDIVKANEVGKIGINKYIWALCIYCGDERWVRRIGKVASSDRCLSCAMKMLTSRTDGKRIGTIERSRNYRKRHPNRAKKQSKLYANKARYDAINHYSNGTMICACCGESNYEFLAIDHINGCGTAMRKLLGHGNLARWLKSRGFPLGYRILCHNCNMSIGFYGYCPHQKIQHTKRELGE